MKKEDVHNLIKSFIPAIMLDAVIPSARRKFIRELLSTIFFVLLIVVLFEKGGDEALGWFAVTFALTIIVFCGEFFYNSYFFAEDAGGSSPKVSFPLASFLYRSMSADPVAVFVLSPYGRWIFSRCGLDPKEAKAFLHVRQTSLDLSGLSLAASGSTLLTLADAVNALISADKGFAQFLMEKGIDRGDIVGAALWCEKREAERADLSRWWSADHLARVPGIAKDWAYGKTYHLDKYARDFIVEARNRNSISLSFGMEEIERLEAVLSRSSQANALVVGEKGDGAFDILYGLARQIDLGKVFPQLEHKRMMILDTAELVAFTKEKAVFEQEIIRIFNEAVKAGNVILVFENLVEFIQSARVIGSDVVSLLSPYFESNALQIVGVVEPRMYHEVVETNADLNRFFEKVSMKETGRNVLITLLQHQVDMLEKKERIYFTYPAIQEIANSAERYFSQGNGMDKANDLLAELVPSVKQQGKAVVDKADVLILVEKKTGIPLGEVAEAEKDKLLNLESLLHKRIIGQEEAVKAISNAMRRSRSGVNNPNRPIGSFLFLGPTGVGKTETTKALAHSFFGNEDQILRLDMSEYRTEDALNRLIGSFADGRSGVLASMLRDKQYGVLLLDEFEKTNREVLDLFLQILDEGYFSDVNGKKVNARNTIIIATSNAGSGLIWEAMKSGENGQPVDLEAKKPEIVDAIVSQGIFKPELLNRFDGIVLFHPLSAEDLAKISRLMLAKVNKRLEDKGIAVAITDELVAYLVEKGSDQKFGARSMNRAVQEKVEQYVADKLLKGEAKPGTSLIIPIADLA